MIGAAVDTDSMHSIRDANRSSVYFLLVAKVDAHCSYRYNELPYLEDLYVVVKTGKIGL
jgi:hypothetical protein